MEHYLAQFVYFFFTVLKFLILVRVILSWLPLRLPEVVSRMIYDTTEPILGFFRRVIPPLGMLDISPIIAIVAVEWVEVLVLSFF